MSDQLENLKAEDISLGDRPLSIPAELPILPLRDTVLFPNSFMPLAVARESSVRLIDDAIANGKLIAVFTQRDAAIEEPAQDDLPGREQGEVPSVLPHGPGMVEAAGLHRHDHAVPGGDQRQDHQHDQAADDVMLFLDTSFFGGSILLATTSPFEVCSATRQMLFARSRSFTLRSLVCSPTKKSYPCELSASSRASSACASGGDMDWNAASRAARAFTNSGDCSVAATKSRVSSAS